MPDTIDAVVRQRAADNGDKPMVIDPDSRITYAELDATTRELAAGFIAAGVGKGTRVGLIMPNCVQWVQIAVALTRIGAVLVPLSTLLQAPELVAQLRVASVQYLVTVQEFRGHRYLDDAGAAAGDPSGAARGVDGRPATAAHPDGNVRRRRGRNRHAQRHTRDHVHLGKQRAAQGRHPLARQCAGRRARRAWPPAASAPTPGCTCRCRSSGWADSAAGCCRRCWPAPRWSPSRSPGPRRRCACWSASGSRCFAAGPIRPKRWHAKTTLWQPISRRCGRAAWKRCCHLSSAPNPARGPSCSG